MYIFIIQRINEGQLIQALTYFFFTISIFYLTLYRIKLDTEVGVYKNNAKIQMEKELIDVQLKKQLGELKGQNFDWA